MYEVSPGRYKITLANEEREIVISLGLKGELYRLITRKQIEYQKLSFKNMLSNDDKAKIKDISEELAAIQKSEEKDEEKIKDLSDRLDMAYAEAYTLLDQRQKEFMEEIAVGSITLSEECMADCIALLLTKRDPRGKVIEGSTLSREDILWGEEYVAMQDELVDLLEIVVNYMQSTLKKISNLSRMLHGLGSELANPIETNQTT